jgi:hypothetical protein
MRRKANAQLVLDQLADRLGAAVAQVVDIVGLLRVPLLIMIMRRTRRTISHLVIMRC